MRFIALSFSSFAFLNSDTKRIVDEVLALSDSTAPASTICLLSSFSGTTMLCSFSGDFAAFRNADNVNLFEVVLATSGSSAGTSDSIVFCTSTTDDLFSIAIRPL